MEGEKRGKLKINSFGWYAKTGESEKAKAASVVNARLETGLGYRCHRHRRAFSVGGLLVSLAGLETVT
jgi:hypothetical protein